MYFGNASSLLYWKRDGNQDVIESVLSCFSSGFFIMITPLAKECFKRPTLVIAEAIVNMLIKPHCAPVLTQYVSEAPGYFSLDEDKALWWGEEGMSERVHNGGQNLIMLKV